MGAVHSDETRCKELHNMRISIKRLRYTMELFRVAYQNGSQQSAVSSYAQYLAVIVDLQEILGDIHDADVVLEVLGEYTSQSGNEENRLMFLRVLRRSLLGRRKPANRIMKRFWRSGTNSPPQVSNRNCYHFLTDQPSCIVPRWFLVNSNM